MAIEVVVPRSGWSMEEGTFAGWIKQPGESVKAGDRLFALESDKSVEEAESMDAGIVWLPPGAPKTGDRVKVGQLLGYLLAPGEAPPVQASTPATAPSPPPSAPAPATPPKPPTELGADIGGQPLPKPAAPPPPAATPPKPAAAPQAAAAPAEDRVTSTPRARRAARDLSVDLQDVAGTGRGGRIRERDVIARAPANPVAQERPLAADATYDGQSVPISRTRRTIAERMVRSLGETAPVTLTTLGDASALVALRSQLAGVVPAAAPGGEATAPSYTEIIVKIVAKALRRHPLLAGRWETDRILLPAAIHIGVAVDTADGLLVPVLRDVDRTPLIQAALRMRALVDSARQGRLRGEDLRGGVFTVTSLGSYGIDEFTPIINQPEAAILGVGAIRKAPWVGKDGILGVREQVTLSLTFDHRIVDGAPAAAFLQTVREGIESPAAWALVDLDPPT